jgi:hypothetical protein
LGWFDVYVQSSALRWEGRRLYADYKLDRIDMVGLFDLAGSNGVVNAVEFNDLQDFTSNALNMDDSVRSLARKVVFGDRANGWFQGQTLGNLAANSSGEHLEKLTDKWFYGVDRPAIASDAEYRYVAGQLFRNDISYRDVDQGGVGDCYFLGPLAQIAKDSPETIQSMITDNGDGTFTVRFYHNGVAEYVTVDRYLPATKIGNWARYAGWGHFEGPNKYYDSRNELWVALIEKAYIQMDQSGWIGQDGNNSYAGIDFAPSSSVTRTLEQITGNNAWRSSIVFSQDVYDRLMADINAGRSIVFESDQFNWGIDRPIVDGHVYVLQSYNPATGLFQLWNPHGWDASDEKPEYVQVTFLDLANHFGYWHTVEV